MSRIRAVQALSMKRFRWLALAATAVLGAIAFPTGPASADIIYTWHEDDGQSASGTLLVDSAVQLLGYIPAPFVKAFDFRMPGGDMGMSFGQFPPPDLFIPVSHTDGGFTGQIGTNIHQAGDLGAAMVNTDLNYQAIGGESWFGNFITNPHPVSGVGHWTVAQVPVPEPSPMILVVIGLACACGFRAVSRRRGEFG